MLSPGPLEFASRHLNRDKSSEQRNGHVWIQFRGIYGTLSLKLTAVYMSRLITYNALRISTRSYCGTTPSPFACVEKTCVAIWGLPVYFEDMMERVQCETKPA